MVRSDCDTAGKIYLPGEADISWPPVLKAD